MDSAVSVRVAFEQIRCISLGQCWCGSEYWLTVVDSLPPNMTTDINIRPQTCKTSQRGALAVVHPNDAAISHLSARQCWSTTNILMALQRLKSVLCFFFIFFWAQSVADYEHWVIVNKDRSVLFWGFRNTLYSKYPPQPSIHSIIGPSPDSVFKTKIWLSTQLLSDVKSLTVLPCSHGGIRPFGSLTTLGDAVRNHNHWVWWGHTQLLAKGWSWILAWGTGSRYPDHGEG